MSARTVLILFMAAGSIYELILMYLSALQRKRPLPPEVSDIYDADRYRKYLSYVSDNRKSALVVSAVTLVITSALYLSGMYRMIEDMVGPNPYLIFIATRAVFWLIITIIDIIDDYHDTFVIEEKYGLNKQDRKGFIKDEALDVLKDIVIVNGLGLLFVFIGDHMDQWTNGFTVSIKKAILFAVMITVVFVLFFVGAALLSLWVMKRQYTFTPLPDGPLHDKIMQLQETSRKKVKYINVYDESKKSTSKNAFLLRFLWHREFGIADNFINENCEDELLGVLSHEVGHLKHKKDHLDYLSYTFLAVLLVLVVLMIHNPDPIIKMNEWIRRSFDIKTNNYYLLIAVWGDLITPLSSAAGIFNKYRSRRQELEADREAVKNGYGEALIRTFKRLSSDELVNVDPHPVIEFLEYSHPGMYHRIKAIREAEKTLKDVSMFP